MDRPHAVIALAIAGCAGGAAPDGEPRQPRYPGVQLATEVVAATAAGPDRFADPGAAVNGVRGGGLRQGSFDVYRIGDAPDDALVLGFEAPVPDGDGPDLVVFENPFAVDGGGWFVDPTVVEVSADCERFAAFPHAYAGGDAYTADPAAWDGFAGLVPVLLHEEDHPVDPLGPEAGGDAFDLADLDDPEIAADGVRCVRLTAAAAHLDPETGAPYPADPISDGPDIDGVYGRTHAPWGPSVVERDGGGTSAAAPGRVKASVRRSPAVTSTGMDSRTWSSAPRARPDGDPAPSCCTADPLTGPSVRRRAPLPRAAPRRP